MSFNSKSSWLFGIWTIFAVFLGATLMSFHQPFLAPASTPEAERTLLALVPPPPTSQWRAVHLLSTSCGCSQRVMRHLLKRRLYDTSEQILLIDTSLPPLPGSSELLAQLQQRGFPITHIAAGAIPPSLNLHGVPLLVLATREGKIAYRGGYGPQGDRDQEILAQLRAGRSPAPLPILGCAFTASLQHSTDPFHLKY
jgi:hypothetical protein